MPSARRCCQTASLGTTPEFPVIPRASKLFFDRQKSAVDRSRKAAVGLVLSSLLAGGAYAAEPAEVFQRSGCVGMALVYATYPFTKFAPKFTQAL